MKNKHLLRFLIFTEKIKWFHLPQRDTLPKFITQKTPRNTAGPINLIEIFTFIFIWENTWHEVGAKERWHGMTYYHAGSVSISGPGKALAALVAWNNQWNGCKITGPSGRQDWLISVLYNNQPANSYIPIQTHTHQHLLRSTNLMNN